MSYTYSPKRKVLAAAITAAVAGTAVAPVQAAGTLEELVVTSTKRAEPMQDIAVSVQAMSGESMDALGVDNFDDYVKYLPNVVFSGRGPGQAELYIRGASTEQSSITITSVQAAAPSVALYQDEQPVSFAGRNLDIYSVDLERIEVLPGPQGTLFGSSSQTGTVRLITNKPNPDGFEAGFDTKFSSTTGGEPSTAVKAYLNLPLSDKLAFRIAAFSDRAGGWIDNVPGTYAADIEVVNRNQISGAAHVCTGKAAVDPAACGGQRATVTTADNSTQVQQDFNDATYSGARFGISYAFNDDWDVLLQYTNQTLETEGVFEYDPNLSGEDSVNRFQPTTNQDEFGLTAWTVNGRFGALEVMYTGAFLDRDVFYTQDYTGYTNGGGYQAYYICTGGYSNASQCFSPVKSYLGQSTNERFTNEFRINTDPDKRWRVTAGVFIDDSESTSDGQFQYQGAVEAGFNQASAPGTITTPANSPPTSTNIDSTVPGVTNPFGRGPSTTFVNSFTREETQLAVFGEIAFDIIDSVTVSFGARYYDLDYEFTGSTGSSFGCKGSPTPCDGQNFDNRVTDRLDALGQFNESGDIADLEAFTTPSGGTPSGWDPDLIAAQVADGSFSLNGLEGDGVINQDDTIFRGTLSWNATDDIMVFGAYSEGYRPQTTNRNAAHKAGNQSGVYEGFLVPAVTKTDELENYEIGIKADVFQSLRVNATAYTSDITDLQMSRFDPANVAFLVFIENVGDAEVSGLDLDLTWVPTDHWTINAALSYVDNELTSVNPQLDEIVVPVGSRLPWTPEFAGNIRARYDFQLASLEADAYARGGISYTGDSRALTTCNAYFIEDVATQVFGNPTSLKIVEEGGFCGTALTGDDLDSVVNKSTVAVDSDGNTRFKAARYEQEDYYLVNIAAGLTKSVDSGRWGVELFVNNLLDENAQININAADWTPSVTTNRPREIGVRFSYDYQ